MKIIGPEQIKIHLSRGQGDKVHLTYWEKPAEGTPIAATLQILKPLVESFGGKFLHNVQEGWYGWEIEWTYEATIAAIVQEIKLMQKGEVEI